MPSKWISHIKTLFEQIERTFFEEVLLEYLIDISNKVKISSEDLYVFESFTLASKSQTFLSPYVFHQPAPGSMKSFYIWGRSDKKYKYTFSYFI